MTKMFCYDVETLSTESTAIVLSAAIVWFDPEEMDVTYEQLVDRALYVKFDVKEQATLGRKASKDTLDWWKKQGALVRELCFNPSKKDVKASDGLTMIRDYIDEHGDKNSFIWARGGLDQLVSESLLKTVNLPPWRPYNNWMDVRTAIRLTKETSKFNGYCEVPGLDLDSIEKHNPIADIALDVLMLTQGK